MHSITLSFATLPELVAAVATLESTRIAGNVPGAIPPAAPAKLKAEKPAPAPVVAAAASAAPAPITAPTPPAPAAAPAVADAAVDYPTLQKAVLKLAGIDPVATAAVATSFGVKTFKTLDSARWAEALVAVNAKLAELEAVA